MRGLQLVCATAQIFVLRISKIHSRLKKFTILKFESYVLSSEIFRTLRSSMSGNPQRIAMRRQGLGWRSQVYRTFATKSR